MSEKCELAIGEVLVTLKNGDITKENVDALVNLTNKTLSHRFGISKEILEAGGSSLREECTRMGKLPHGDVVVTGAGDLKCKNIIHVIGAKRPASIVKAVKEVLEECDDNQLDTVAFPAMGTGAVCLDPQESMKSILKGIREHMSSNIRSSLSGITIVTFTPNVHQGYLKVMKSEIDKLQNPNQSFTIFGTTVELILGDIIEQSVDCVLNLTNFTLNQSVGVSGAILSAAGKIVTDECAGIGRLSWNEIVVTSGGNLKSRHIMHVIGPVTVSSFAPALEKILKKCKDKSFKTVAFPAIGTGTAGIKPKQSMEAILDGITKCLAIMEFSEFTKILIIAYQEEIHSDYLKVFQDRVSQENKLKVCMMKQLQEVIDTPAKWGYMGMENYKSVELHKDSDEFKNVENDFRKCEKNAEVTKIERIQNMWLWQGYALNKYNVDQMYPEQENERRLYHGTAYQTTEKINRHGFNRSFIGKNGTVYGKGTYFAANASYTCIERFSPKDGNGEKRVYQVAVITGKYVLGKSEYVEPPAINDNSGALYTTTVNNVSNPTIFVVYNDYGAYPEYLITFKSSV
ncbi:protein mono-ADP-ribosyltransferase PARP15-like [Pelodytes ibericus]